MTIEAQPIREAAAFTTVKLTLMRAIDAVIFGGRAAPAEDAAPKTRANAGLSPDLLSYDWGHMDR